MLNATRLFDEHVVHQAGHVAAQNELVSLSPRLAPDDGADIVHPVRFAVPTCHLSALDRSSAVRADLPPGVGKMIFSGVPVGFFEVGVGKAFAFFPYTARS